MARSARLLDLDDEPPGLLREGLALSARAVTQNPALVGGITAFAITLFYVSANALWNQPHFHSGAFFQTRVAKAERIDSSPMADDGDVTRFRSVLPAQPGISDEPVNSIPVPAEPPTRGTGELPANADKTVLHVQRILSELGLYDGAVDGLTGPKTRAAIGSYRQIVGLGTGGEIDAALLKQLGAPVETDMPAQAPIPTGTPGRAESVEPQAPAAEAALRDASATPVNNAQVVRIQAGLRAFGNDGIVIDGIAGSDTRAAIREFQTLFGLEVTGEPDDALYAKMKEIGLTD